MNVALVLVISAWIAIGVVLSVLMGRRGHNAFGWLIIGVFLGPLSIPLAVASARHESRPVRPGLTGLGSDRPHRRARRIRRVGGGQGGGQRIRLRPSVTGVEERET